jgi:hypothetical protein
MPVQDIGRLAMRVEGGWWVAYWAGNESMKRSTEIARLRMSLAADPVLKDRFMDFCRLAMALAIKEATGKTANWKGAVRAPEHERSGRG